MLTGLIRKELLVLSRDPHALAALFLMPAVFIIVMSFALKNMYAPSLDRLAYGIVSSENTEIATRFMHIWENTHGPALGLDPNSTDALRQGRLDYVLTLEAGMAEAISSPHPPPEAVVRLQAEPGLDQGALRTLQAELTNSLSDLRASALQAEWPDLMPAVTLSILPFVAVEQISTDAAKPSAVQQNVPAWLVFGMFFVVTAIASLFVQEQRDGTLARLAGIGVPHRIQVLAKALPYVAVNIAQAALMIAVGVYLMPLLGGEALSLAGIHWPALTLVVGAVSFAAIGFALLLACLVRTHAQANALGPMLNILMAAFGGIMVPTFVMPSAMQTAATYSPMNWGLEGLLTVLLRHGDVSETLPWVGRLCLFGAITLLLAGTLFPRRIKR